MHGAGCDRRCSRLGRPSFLIPLMTAHVRYNSWYISLPSSAQQEHDIIKFRVAQRTTFILNVSPCPRFSFMIALTLRNKGKSLKSIAKFLSKILNYF